MVILVITGPYNRLPSSSSSYRTYSLLCSSANVGGTMTNLPAPGASVSTCCSQAFCWIWVLRIWASVRGAASVTTTFGLFWIATALAALHRIRFSTNCTHWNPLHSPNSYSLDSNSLNIENLAVLYDLIWREEVCRDKITTLACTGK